MKQLIGFLKQLKSFWKLYWDFDYDGNELRFIVTQYEKILYKRTDWKHSNKDIIKQLDEWYAERSD